MANYHLLGSDAPDLETFLRSAGIPTLPTNMVSLKGGANNRVFRLDFQDFSSLVLKSYFQHPHDPRLRLKAEFEFLSFAWEQEIHSIPQPHFQNPISNLALYSFLEGTFPMLSNANASFVNEAITFLILLNQKKEAGRHLLRASEACFTIEEHYQIIEKRIQRLWNIPQELPIEKQLHSFLQNELLPTWQRIESRLCKAALHELNPSSEDLILSPSDFGLHNVLISAENRPYFIDFEYAGWDDPAKTVCDFFLQPKIPIPLTFLDSFLHKIAFNLTQNPQRTLDRVNLIFPLYSIKWCCIILNVFQKIDRSRREFAASDQIHNLEKQLELAKTRLSLLNSNRP